MVESRGRAIRSVQDLAAVLLSESPEGAACVTMPSGGSGHQLAPALAAPPTIVPPLSVRRTPFRSDRDSGRGALYSTTLGPFIQTDGRARPQIADSIPMARRGRTFPAVATISLRPSAPEVPEITCPCNRKHWTYPSVNCYYGGPKTKLICQMSPRF